MGDAVIRVERVSKKFCRRLRQGVMYGTFDVARGMLGMKSRTDALRPGEFWAVKDVSFELKRGETLGLIGQNGSGKSTLLRLLNGIYQPDTGRIEIRGRVGALIAVGAGFHPLMTGRENIYLNGAILGMSHAEIKRKFDSIVDFADIGEFLDAPVKTYSSGMHAKLGFAIAVHCELDILLVDEVLAVGDFLFKQKCSAKINEMRNSASVIFVSHNLREVNMLCDRVLVLDGGEVAFAGQPLAATNRFMEIVQHRETGNASAGTDASARPSIFGERHNNREKITDVRHIWKGAEGSNVMKHGNKMMLDFSFRILGQVKNLIIGVPIWDTEGYLITSLSTDLSNTRIKINSGGIVSGTLVLDPVILNPAIYVSAFAVVDGREYLYRDFNENFKVTSLAASLGCITHEHKWAFSGASQVR